MENREQVREWLETEALVEGCQEAGEVAVGEVWQQEDCTVVLGWKGRWGWFLDNYKVAHFVRHGMADWF